MNATGIPQPAANKYLGVLADLRIVERETPVTEAQPLKSRKGLYRITDAFVRSWFRFVFPHRDRLEMGQIQDVMDEIRPLFTRHVAESYEIAVRDLLVDRSSDRFPFTRLGRWWDRETEIDLVALDPHRNAILFGEAKWSEKPVGTDILAALREKALRVAWGEAGRTERFALFSRSGFTPDLLRRAEKENLLLFHGDALLPSDGTDPPDAG